MRYQIIHNTRYHYAQPVKLGEHTLRLQPRGDGAQHLHQFTCEILPTPQKTIDWLDLDGNICRQVWFPDSETTTLTIVTQCSVETQRTNPFDYISPGWATHAPINYPRALYQQLLPYFTPLLPDSPTVVDWAQQQLHRVDGNVSLFLTDLTNTIYQTYTYETRHDGPPWPAAKVLAEKRGSCRDFTVLFMVACRAVGLAARFVSGYQQGDLEHQTSYDLHAWPEIYIPGGGWRGFDPTLGLAVADGHITLAASLDPRQAAPVGGSLQPGYHSQNTMKSTIQISLV